VGQKARNRGLLLIVLLALFALAGLARLNPFCLLEPDIPGYLLSSRSLATFDGYRDIDAPGEPRHAFRPPGLPLLLAPLSLASPYNVPAAKVLVLASTLLAFSLLWIYARKVCGDWAALLVLLLIAASPYSLLFATEVMSEFPYLAFLFAILLLLRGEGRFRLSLLFLLLAFLPFIRTIGVVWIVAIGLLGLTRRVRWKWSIAAALALAPTLLWSWRNGSAGGPTYLGAILKDLEGSSASEHLERIGAGVWYYLEAFFGLLIPALEPGKPLYERVLVAPAPDLGGLFGLAALPAIAFASLFLCGLWSRRKEEGGLIALQTMLLFTALAIYPPRHERLVWPLLPLALIYAVAGVRFLAERLRPVNWVTLAAAALLVGWQALACGLMVSTNLSWLRLGDRFYSEQAPPMYYADWQAAGRWIASSAPAEARILTRHSDVGFTARRYQDSLRFEELSPAVWRRSISQFHARYLVVPTTLCGRMFPFHLLDSDPVYNYEIVHEARDVAVLELLPNTTGHVGLQSSLLPEALRKCAEIKGRQPDRIDLTRRLAELLLRADRPEEAEQVLRVPIAAGVRDAGLHISLGMVFERQERYGEALDQFAIARRMPKAGLLLKRIDRGAERAQSALALQRAGGPTAQQLVESARRKMSILGFAQAREDADRALELAPAHPAALSLHADLQRVAGKRVEAPEGLTEQQYIRRAVRLAGEGRPGGALSLLEDARDLYPSSPAVKHRLADLYLFYGLVRESAALYREVLGSAPGNEAARRGLQRSLEASELPSF
jgi:tetratricopeptide (TPR) repeat protein